MLSTKHQEFKEDNVDQQTVVPENFNDYDKRFVAFSEKVEGKILRAAVLFVILLLLTQLLLTHPVIRQYLVPVEKLEGVPFQPSPVKE